MDIKDFDLMHESKSIDHAEKMAIGTIINIANMYQDEETIDECDLDRIKDCLAIIHMCREVKRA